MTRDERIPTALNIFEEAEAELYNIYNDWFGNCIGGGVIDHEPESKKIKVFGYSEGLGRADHELAISILKKKYTDYKMTWSNESY
ncbi:PREDICTED: 14 kDa phosphohistidine phosphatase-like [Ceratosolen solmsi marchali]|uniref:14 kDa phosphohistidine phosphatase-like n=1 Tax=Ceratosolen solmsi marchali TaxID=326594 RepID=A0AAJ6YY65_9HYME|nr:PREDICTED: 14 kDa phosphohistidine phosphatase-like [Ceratosolen solmsi marchali]